MLCLFIFCTWAFKKKNKQKKHRDRPWVEMACTECEGGFEGFRIWIERPVTCLLIDACLLICGMSEPEHPRVVYLSLYWKESHRPISVSATRTLRPAEPGAGPQPPRPIPPAPQAHPSKGEGDRRTIAGSGSGSLCESRHRHAVMYGIRKMWPPSCWLPATLDDIGHRAEASINVDDCDKNLNTSTLHVRCPFYKNRHTLTVYWRGCLALAIYSLMEMAHKMLGLGGILQTRVNSFIYRWKNRF